MARFGFFVGCLSTTDIFSREMEEYLKESGHEVLEININFLDKDVKRLIREHSKNPICAVIAFNNLGYLIGEEDEDFWDKLGIVYIDILMDHPFHFHSKLSHLSKNTRLYTIDKNHVKFVKKYYSDIKNVSFLPHAGCFYESQKALDVFDRDIDILYPGNLSRTLVENLIPDFEEFSFFDGVDFSQEVLGFLINNPDSTTEDVISKVLMERGISFSPEEELKIISAFRFIDGFAVSYFRELSVRILVENGFKVTALGNGWKSCDWADNENLNILDPVSPEEVLFFMKRSKVVLNTMTWFKEGAHDRIFNAALCGASVLTDTSGYLLELFTSEDISFFNLKEISRIPYIAESLLSDSSYRLRQSERAYNITKASHTWGNRMESIIRDLKEII